MHPAARLTLALAATMLIAPAPSSADPSAPLSGEAFEAEVTGHTLTYSEYGVIYGIEQYLPGRRVRWRFADDECQIGRWFARDDQICFVYEGSPQEHCWQFWRDENGLNARLMDDAPAIELSQVAESDQPLTCAGPDVGV